MGDVIDFRTRETFKPVGEPCPIDDIVSQLIGLRDEIGVALVVFRYKDGIDDWIETDMLPDTRIALATFLLNESTRNIATYLMLEDEADEPDPEPA